MSELPVLITARLGSQRLPAKHLTAMASGKSAIECLLARLRNSKAPLVLCIPTGSEDDRLAAVAVAQDIGCFRGDPDNVLIRYQQAMDAYGIPAAVIVDADDLFVSTEAIRDILDRYADHDLITCAGMPYGGAPYLLSRRFIASMLDQSCSPNGWSRFLTSLPGHKLALENHRVTPDAERYRLSLDYDEDLDLMRYLFASLGEPEHVGLQQVVDHITANLEGLRERFPTMFDGTVARRAAAHIDPQGATNRPE